MKRFAALCGTAIFLASSLLFLLEPMAAKRLLPLLGGSSAIWITCLVFFQCVLLLGYLFSHLVATHLSLRAQGIVYLGLLLVSLIQGGISMGPAPHADTMHPIVSVLKMLALLIGLPFLALSGTNPLLQSWYAKGLAPAAGNQQRPPYRLYSLSNLGSLLALVSYPALVEPYVNLHTQLAAWWGGFLLLTIVCGVIVWQVATSGDRVIGESGDRKDEQTAELTNAKSKAEEPAPDWKAKVMWVLLAACGSIFLSAVTNELSQNIVAMPLLWVVPLSIYLFTFVLAFQREIFYIPLLVLGVLAALAGGVEWFIYQDNLIDAWKMVSLMCGMLFFACLFCHGELYRRRPLPRYATSFYLLIATGGALGAIFVGVMAPLLFRAPHEIFVGVALTGVLALIATWNGSLPKVIFRSPEMVQTPIRVMLRLFWTSATIAAIVMAVLQDRKLGEQAIVQVRSFYGVLRVVQENAGTTRVRTLYNGIIEHGDQYFDEEFGRWPTTYYGHDSGVGLAMDLCCDKRPRRVGMIGLGTGTLAAYGHKGDVFRFYDIDPLVIGIAKNVFTYLRDSEAAIEIVPGDARLSMAAEAPQHYDVLVIDAFSGDSIPVHLLTAEAIALYRKHLQPDGILAFHISSHYLELGPVIREEAEHAGMKYVMVSNPEDDDTLSDAADWVLVTINQGFLDEPKVVESGDQIKALPGLRLWTDDYNSLLPILRWKEKKEKAQEEEDKGKE